jgi:hypothetical protein
MLFNATNGSNVSLGLVQNVPLQKLYQSSTLSADILSVTSSYGFRGSRIFFELSVTQMVAFMGNKACVFDSDGTIGSTLTLKAANVIFVHQYTTDNRKFLVVYADGSIEHLYLPANKTIGYQTSWYADWRVDLPSTLSGRETTACAFDENLGRLIICSHSATVDPFHAGIYNIGATSASFITKYTRTDAGLSNYLNPGPLAASLSINPVSGEALFISTWPASRKYFVAAMTYTTSTITEVNYSAVTGTHTPIHDAEANCRSIGGNYGAVTFEVSGTPSNDIACVTYLARAGSLTRTEHYLQSYGDSSTLVAPLVNTAPVVNSDIVFFGTQGNGREKALVGGIPILLSGAATLPTAPLFEAIALRNGRGLAIAYQNGSTSRVKLWTI